MDLTQARLVFFEEGNRQEGNRQEDIRLVCGEGDEFTVARSGAAFVRWSCSWTLGNRDTLPLRPEIHRPRTESQIGERSSQLDRFRGVEG